MNAAEPLSGVIGRQARAAVTPANARQRPMADAKPLTGMCGPPTRARARRRSRKGREKHVIVPRGRASGPPTRATTQPTSRTGQRMNAIERLSGVTGLQTRATGRPMRGTGRPTTATARPTSATAPPTSATARPTSANARLTSASGQPMTAIVRMSNGSTSRQRSTAKSERARGRWRALTPDRTERGTDRLAAPVGPAASVQRRARPQASPRAAARSVISRGAIAIGGTVLLDILVGGGVSCLGVGRGRRLPGVGFGGLAAGLASPAPDRPHR
jgi:hypothetical protein